MKRTIALKWIAALRSGKYKQLTGALTNGDRTEFCCLGVLCDISKQGKWDVDQYATKNSWAATLTLPPKVMKWAGIDNAEGEITFKNKTLDLLELNDTRGRSFKQLAAYIERNWEKL